MVTASAVTIVSTGTVLYPGCSRILFQYTAPWKVSNSFDRGHHRLEDKQDFHWISMRSHLSLHYSKLYLLTKCHQVAYSPFKEEQNTLMARD